MYHLKKEDMKKITPLFDDWNETLIWSCLQGCMGNAWTDDIKNLKSAQIITADFCFFAGIPNIELVRNIPSDYTQNYIEIALQSDKWANLIEQVYENKLQKGVRYSIKKEYNVFDTEKLRSYVKNLPSEYNIVKIDEALYSKVKSENWSKYFCSHFTTYEEYQKHGLGFVAFHHDICVSGASSYIYYDKGIEIEVDTKTEYRRKGLALACASRLILECLDKGLYPSWDAANKASVSLAEKLGYHFDKEYGVYEITNFR